MSCQKLFMTICVGLKLTDSNCQRCLSGIDETICILYVIGAWSSVRSDLQSSGASKLLSSSGSRETTCGLHTASICIVLLNIDPLG